MKLTVCKYLNERIGSPSISASSANFKLPGTFVDIEAVVYGDEIDGNGIWYKSTEGYYYWSGGFVEVNFALPGCKIESFSSSNQVKILKQLQAAAYSVFKQTVLGYLGCGFGYKNYAYDQDNDLSIIIYVDKKVQESDPVLQYKVVKDILFWGFIIKTDVAALNTAHHHYDTTGKNKHNMELDIPLRIGGGVEDSGLQNIGTRSLAVSRRASNGLINYYLIASYHVLLDSLIEKNKKNDYDGTPVLNSLFPLDDNLNNNTHKIVEGSYNSDYDYVAIQLNSQSDVLNKINDLDVSGFFDYDQIYTLKDKNVVTIGYASGKQTGRVLSLFNNITLMPHNQEFENVIFTERISTEGDSGAPVIEQESKKLIGFIIGGNDDNTSFILPYYNLNYEKKFQIL
jgi:hypothetical protein